MKIVSGDLSCEINQNGGFVEWVKFRDNDIIKKTKDHHKTHGGIAPLFPYANRIEGGTYIFNGKKYTFERGKDGNSIHGYAKDVDWNIVEEDEDSVTLETSLFRDEGYPFKVKCTVHICVSGSRFCEVAHFHNQGENAAPISPGFHPYFMVGKEWNLSLERRALKSIKRDEYFPSGNYIEFFKNIKKKKAGYFDDLFKYSGLMNLYGERYSYNIETTNAKYFMIYDGEFAESTSVAIEPMSSPVNSFQTGDDLKILNTNEIWPFGFSFSVEEITLSESA
ncbi:aldose 1-epimerase [Cuniculiplasma sp. SKW4]|uniref:aldose 1-epimerase n=1 Tax=Cuniculiplasma sp. SKW4 TaxID=3400171 RepID=UPI003FD43E1F